jgi:hypothetical protein
MIKGEKIGRMKNKDKSKAAPPQPKSIGELHFIKLEAWPDDAFKTLSIEFRNAKSPKEQINLIHLRLFDTTPFKKKVTRLIDNKVFTVGFEESDEVINLLIDEQILAHYEYRRNDLKHRLGKINSKIHRLDLIDEELLTIDRFINDSVWKEERPIDHERLQDGYRRQKTLCPFNLVLQKIDINAGAIWLTIQGGTAYKMELLLKETKGLIEKGVTDIARIFPDDTKFPDSKYHPNFDKLFFIASDAERSLKVLRLVDPPIIDNSNHYLLGERDKSAITAWIELLFRRQIIKKTPDDIMAGCLNTTLKNFTITGKTLRCPGTKGYKKYKTHLSNAIASEFGKAPSI